MGDPIIRNMLTRLLLGIPKPDGNSTNRFRLAFVSKPDEGERPIGWHEFGGGAWLNFPLSVDDWDLLQEQLQMTEHGPTALLIAVTPMEPMQDA